MKGFFKREDLSKIAPVRLTGCASCGLANGCLHPKMEPSGEGKKQILIIAEAPGEDEDKKGTQLIGKVGQRLRRTLRGFGVDLDQDCRKTNSVRCRPPGNRTPEPNELESCRHHIFEEIERTKPKLIILLGSSAIKSLLGHRWKGGGEMGSQRWRGLKIPDQELNAWICPTFHPSYVSRSEYSAPAAEVIWKRDLQKALELINSPIPKAPEPDIQVIKDDKVYEYLLDLWKRAKGSKAKPYEKLKPGTPEWMSCWKRHPELQGEMILFQQGAVTANLGMRVAFDYETTGKKPYREEQKIICNSVAESAERVVVFPFHEYRKGQWVEVITKQSLAMWREFCLLPLIRKIGANNNFEQNWTRAKCGHGIENWWWDCTNAAKVLDNRPGNMGMKFQAYTRLGIIDYNSHISDLLKSVDGSSNGLNRIHEIPPEDLYEYCGKDGAFEYAVCMKQRKDMDLQ